mmetsp:Transcript_17213/g.51391  ORF Transcript_17213/g.51391 Transcript_17213/m.51391 type:complete len:171 (+) Transcript_17213:79-591(+)
MRALLLTLVASSTAVNFKLALSPVPGSHRGLSVRGGASLAFLDALLGGAGSEEKVRKLASAIAEAEKALKAASTDGQIAAAEKKLARLKASLADAKEQVKDAVAKAKAKAADAEAQARAKAKDLEKRATAKAKDAEAQARAKAQELEKKARAKAKKLEGKGRALADTWLK